MPHPLLIPLFLLPLLVPLFASTFPAEAIVNYTNRPPPLRCTTEKCRIASDFLLNDRNPQWSPCTNIWKYACSIRESKPQVVEDDRKWQSAEYERNYKDYIDTFNEMLKGPIERLPEYYRELPRIYDSCMSIQNASAIEEEYLNLLLKDAKTLQFDELWSRHAPQSILKVESSPNVWDLLHITAANPSLISIEYLQRRNFSAYGDDSYEQANKDTHSPRLIETWQIYMNRSRGNLSILGEFKKLEELAARIAPVTIQTRRFNAEYTHQEFIREFSTPTFDFARYFDALKIFDVSQFRKIRVPDRLHVLWIVRVLSDIENHPLLKEYMIWRAMTEFNDRFTDYFNDQEPATESQCRQLVSAMYQTIRSDAIINSPPPFMMNAYEIASKAARSTVLQMIEESVYLEATDKELLRLHYEDVEMHPSFTWPEETRVDGHSMLADWNDTNMVANGELLAQFYATWSYFHHGLGSMVGSPFAHNGRVFGQIHNAYGTFNLHPSLEIVEITSARIIYYLLHELGHTIDMTLHETAARYNMTISSRIRHHFHRVNLCQRKINDNSFQETDWNNVGHFSGYQTREETFGDGLASSAAARAFLSIPGLRLLPRFDSLEEMFYMIVARSEFCISPHKVSKRSASTMDEHRSALLAAPAYSRALTYLLKLEHPMIVQRVRFVAELADPRIYDAAFHCTAEEREKMGSCPSIF